MGYAHGSEAKLHPNFAAFDLARSFPRGFLVVLLGLLRAMKNNLL